MVNPDQVKAAICNALPGALVEVEDLTTTRTTMVETVDRVW